MSSRGHREVSRWTRLAGPRQENEALRDRDRILYASSFRRLGGVTQVASTGETALLHNRLTHSLKVGQVGRKIADTLNGLAAEDGSVRAACFKYGGAATEDHADDEPVNPWVVEAAGMLHDAGHPPFGHIAEATLNAALSATPNQPQKESLRITFPPVGDGYHLRDGFEGNAQTFRIATRLAVGPLLTSEQEPIVGLDLTRALLSAVSKYPWTYGYRPEGVDPLKQKWGAYDSEYSVLKWAMGYINGADARTGRDRPDGGKEFRSIEAQAMDWADDVTYAVHDLEDFSRAGLIPLEDLTSNSGPSSPLVLDLWDYCKERLLKTRMLVHKYAAEEDPESAMHQDFLDVLGALPPSATGRRVDRNGFRAWATNNIDYLTGTDAISLLPDVGLVDIDRVALLSVEVLKKLTWYFVIDKPALASAQFGQARLIRELFVWLTSWVDGCYQGPESPHVGRERRSYSINGLPPRLIDCLDMASWQSPENGGYATDKERAARACTDFISSLTESQAVALHARMSGANINSMLDEGFNA
ncbi:deoxyguanosinetriphosphate triphosphohydrolase family protein [Geodermatophilus sp. SYSU D00691]